MRGPTPQAKATRIDASELDERLVASEAHARTELTATGLRMDQAGALVVRAHLAARRRSPYRPGRLPPGMPSARSRVG